MLLQRKYTSITKVDWQSMLNYVSFLILQVLGYMIKGALRYFYNSIHLEGPICQNYFVVSLSSSLTL